jgi:hypothetical protein
MRLRFTGTLTNTTNAAITVAYTVTLGTAMDHHRSRVTGSIITIDSESNLAVYAAQCNTRAADFTGTNIIPTGTT